MRVVQTAVPTKKGSAAVSKQPREVLAELRSRAGMSVAKVAKELGYASPPGYARYEQAKVWGDKKIPHDVIRRLIPLWRGAGNPAIKAEELLAISDASNALPKPVIEQFQSVATVDDGAGLLVVRYRVDPGTFTRETGNRMLGAARIGSSPSYPVASQFVAVTTDRIGEFCAACQLHCIDPAQFSSARLEGKKVVVRVPYRGGDLSELTVGVVSKVEDGEPIINGLDGMPVYGGVIVGVVIGFYQIID